MENGLDFAKRPYDLPGEQKARGRRRTALETCTAAALAQLDGGAMPVNMDKYLTLRYPEPATI